VDNPLQAVSNVIELKSGHKYLLVFKNTHYGPDQLDYLATQLHKMGYQCFAIATYSEDGDVQVIEVPPAKEQEG
jgi:hypothetical protein